MCGGIIPVSDSVRWGEDFPDARLDPPRRREAGPERLTAAFERVAIPSVVPPPTRETPTGQPGRAPLFAPPPRATPATPTQTPVFPASTLRPPTPAFTPTQGAAPRIVPGGAQPPFTSLTAPAGGSIPTRETPTSPASAPSFVPQPTGPTAAAAASSATAVPRRPINPFLSNDPNQKARRLARVLVSDMVTYHPQKRDEGLRAGTLKQLFREEIKKSYEEYVEQVGREFAEATSHFQDALNDILAAGKRLF